MKVYVAIMKVFFNCCMLEQSSQLGKFWFLRYGPKCSWPIRVQDFSINRRTLKLAVSHEEINGINWFLVCPSYSFLRTHQVFLIFGTMVDNSNIEKLADLCQNSFMPKFGQKGPRMAPKQVFLDFLKNFVMFVFLGNNLK